MHSSFDLDPRTKSCIGQYLALLHFHPLPLSPYLKRNLTSSAHRALIGSLGSGSGRLSSRNSSGIFVHFARNEAINYVFVTVASHSQLLFEKLCRSFYFSYFSVFLLKICCKHLGSCFRRCLRGASRKSECVERSDVTACDV